jgi:hypothetical protein
MFAAMFAENYFASGLWKRLGTDKQAHISASTIIADALVGFRLAESRR